jgi:hypothetical protein
MIKKILDKYFLNIFIERMKDRLSCYDLEFMFVKGANRLCIKCNYTESRKRLQIPFELIAIPYVYIYTYLLQFEVAVVEIEKHIEKFVNR